MAASALLKHQAIRIQDDDKMIIVSDELYMKLYIYIKKR